MKKILFSVALCSFAFAKSYIYNDENNEVFIFFNDNAIFSISKTPPKQEYISQFDFPKTRLSTDDYNNMAADKTIIKILKANAKITDIDINEYQNGADYANFILPYSNKDCAELNEARSKATDGENTDSWYCSNSVALMYHKDDLSSFCDLYQEYSGGAHPNYTISCKNYILEHKLELADFIINIDEFKNLVVKKLQKAITDNILSSDYIQDFTYTDSVYFTKNGLVLVYSPYEIAPYSSGAFSVFLQKDELKDILKEDFFKYFE